MTAAATVGLAGLGASGGGPARWASPIGQDRIVRKEVALGMIREIVQPEQHIGLSLWPWLEVGSDDVIFNYALGMVDDLAPARAEDSEAEMSRMDDIFAGEGRASVIDWAIKDHYTASDISRYREWLRIQELIRDTNSYPLTIGSITEDWAAKVARHTLRRRRKLDNRMEWLIMNQVLLNGKITYNDGKIKFNVDFGRPAGQVRTLGTHSNIAGNANYPLGSVWSGTSSDPIKDIQSVQQHAYDTYGVRIDRAIASRRILNNILNSDRFAARTGLVASATPVPTVDPKYLIDGWGPLAAQEIVEKQTGLKFIEYDAVYRTRSWGSQTVTVNRFTDDDKVIFLPNEADVAEFDDTQLGFGRMLTSPHPEGNWAAGFYEWEQETKDPWGYSIGTGVKAFPVFPHMDMSYVLDVL